MRFFLTILALGLLAFTWTKNPDKPVAEVPQEVRPQPEAPTPQVESSELLNQIVSTADSSKCAQYSFKGQGKAPKGYLRGVALSYARAACNGVELPTGGTDATDALVHFGISTDDDLRATYALLIGHGMRESSGRWCVGKDPGATNTSAETCEAGLFQTSLNSTYKKPYMMDFYKSVKANPEGCFFSVYSKDISCSASNLKNWGTGEGVAFQKLSKDCPGFATDYAARMIRVGRKHYGPLYNTSKYKAEFRHECFDMLGEVKKLVKANPTTCLSLR
ncbi:hypothetical protein phi1422_0001 [Bdellovibrio phage phi1422]|uniref:hypothetical protein n=1 Tax=Bdellovibrio phage phi1422 TaxID=1127515 RepID=UPI0002536D00|nr:hypothetical protein F395_gp01 [Bdellovibrio phage phi1422]AFC22521.1 hypothetical protein phi1422_0001 [Bdellovibrio phage phi1422]